MFHRFGYQSARFVAMLAICLQIVLPSAMSVAQSNGVDVGSYLCAPSGKAPSAEAIRALSRFAEILGGEAPDGAPIDEHCSLCTLAQSVTLPEPIRAGARVKLVYAPVYSPYQPGFVHKPQGPPTGSRAPPILT